MMLFGGGAASTSAVLLVLTAGNWEERGWVSCSDTTFVGSGVNVGRVFQNLKWGGPDGVLIGNA
jgi:hypothetical protein